MAVISLQLFTGQLIDVEPSTDFSLKSENPFFCVGITELAHTQDFSVPATQNNNRIFNVDNSVIMEGWRRGRDCWLGYSAGEIAGRLFIKDYNKDRYNLLFIWGAEIADVLNQKIIDYVKTGLSLTITANPVLKAHVDDFGWCNFAETYADLSFADGVSMLPTINLGYLMDTAATYAGYTITQDGLSLSSVTQDQYNPYKYGINIDTLNVGDTYTLGLGNWAASGVNVANFQLFDENNVPVPLSAGGLQLFNIQLPTNQPNVPVVGYCFKATRQIKLKLVADTNVICLALTGPMVGQPEGNGGQFPYIEFNTVLTLNTGQGFTFLHVNDFDTYTWKPKYNGYTTPITYNSNIIDSETVANVGDVVSLDNNLPDYSLLELVRNWCLMTSSFFVIDEENKVINILSIESVIAGRFSNNITDINKNRNILDVAALRRYIDGLSQHNNIVCQSADYVAEINRYRADYPCDNDLLDNDSEFGTITFNEGNINGSGEAIFKNFEPQEGGGVTMRPAVGVFMFNEDGGSAYHLQWVEGNYDMHNAMASITAEAVTIEITIHETLAQYLSHQYNELFSYDGCMWVAKSYTWKDNATQMTLVKVDNAMALAFTPIDYLRFSGNGTIYLRTKLNLDIEISQDGENFSPWTYEKFGGYRYYYTLTLSAGQTYYMRGNNPTGLANAANFSQFFMSGSIYVAGDIGTLINRTGGENLTIPDYAFKSLFSGCSSMLSAPELPFKDTGDYSCYQMFYNCSSLGQLITRMTSNTGNNGTYQWLYGVAATGDFYCPQSLVIVSNDPSGIPSGWTRHNL